MAALLEDLEKSNIKLLNELAIVSALVSISLSVFLI